MACATTPQPAPTRVSAQRHASGPLALTGAAVLFVLYPALRPWGDATPAGAPSAFASPAWIIAHLAGVAGFVLVGAGLLALRDGLAPTPGRWLAGVSLGAWWIGTGLVLPYYGAESFALHAIGERIGRTGDPSPLDLVENIRLGTAQVIVFGSGLLLLAVAGTLAALAVARSQVLSRWAGVPFAAGFVLYLPQFSVGPGLRIAHGVLVAVGCVLLAAQLRRLPR